MKILGCVVWLLISQVSWAQGPACDTLFSHGKKPKAQNWKKTLSKLEELPAVALDTPTLQQGIERFWEEMRNLNHGFQTYDKVRLQVAKGQISKEAATETLEKLAQWSAQDAEKKLALSDTTEQGRKALEAHRLLLKSINGLNEALTGRSETPKPPTPQPKSPGPDSNENTDHQQDQEGVKPSESTQQLAERTREALKNKSAAPEPPKTDSTSRDFFDKLQEELDRKDQSSKPEKDSAQTEQVQEQESRQPSPTEQFEQLKQQQPKDASAKDDSKNEAQRNEQSGQKENSDADKLEKMRQELKEENPESEKNEEGESSSSNEKQKGNKPSPEESTENQIETESDNAERSKQQSKDQKGKPGESSKEDGDAGQQTKANPGQQADQQSQKAEKGEQGQKSERGQQGDQAQQGQKGKQGQQGQKGQQGQQGQEGSQKGEQGQQSNQKGQPGQQKGQSSRDPDGKTQAGQSGTDSKRSGHQAPQENPSSQPSSKEASESTKDNSSDKFFGNSKNKSKNQPKINTDFKDSALQKSVLKNYLISALRQYRSSEGLLEGIKGFYLLCGAMAGKGHDAALMYKSLANELRIKLDGMAVQYKDLDSLAADMAVNGRTNPEQLIGKMNFLEVVLSSLKKETSLFPEEEALLSLLQNTLSKLAKKGDATNQEIVEQFLRQLPGPLSRKFFKDTAGSGGELDVNAAAEKIKNGEVSSLLTLSALKRFTKLNSFARPYPSKKWIHDGYKIPMDDVEPQLESVEDLANFKNIFRDGPPSRDLDRMAAGDLLENVYRERSPIRGTKNPKEREVYILLYDMSESMKRDNRFEFQASVMASVMDSAQVKIMRGNSVSFVMVPFAAEAYQPTKISTLQEFAQFFESLLRNPPVSNGSTSITNALVKALEMVKEAQEQGGDLARAHIIISTDGDNTIDFGKVKDAKDKVLKKTAISLHAITMVVGNPNLKRLVTSGLAASQQGKSSYQFFSEQQVKELMSQTTNLDSVIQGAKNNAVKNDGALTGSDISALSGKISLLSHKAESRASGSEVLALERWLKTPAPDRPELDLTRFTYPIFALDVGQSLSASHRKLLRLNFILGFFESVTKDLKISKEDFIANISRSEKAQLLQWVQN